MELECEGLVYEEAVEEEKAALRLTLASREKEKNEEEEKKKTPLARAAKEERHEDASTMRGEHVARGEGRTSAYASTYAQRLALLDKALRVVDVSLGAHMLARTC